MNSSEAWNVRPDGRQLRIEIREPFAEFCARLLALSGTQNGSELTDGRGTLERNNNPVGFGIPEQTGKLKIL